MYSISETWLTVGQVDSGSFIGLTLVSLKTFVMHTIKEVTKSQSPIVDQKKNTQKNNSRLFSMLTLVSIVWFYK